MKYLFVDYEKCVGCEICALRCSLEKTGVCNPSAARIHIVREEEQGVMMPAVCRHCDEPRCAPVCPVKAISKDAPTGLVRIDPDVCIGCKLCAEACPYGGPTGIPRPGGQINPSATIKVLCDLCGGNPACTDMCPTAALQFLGPDAVSLRRQREGQEKLAVLLARRR